MAAYAALVSLLNHIHTIMNHPRLSTSLDNTHIQPLVEKTGFLLDFIEGNNYGGGSKEAQDLERKIAFAAHAAEDLIESHIVDQIQEASSERSYLLNCLLKSVGCRVSDKSEKSLDLKQINEDMHAIVKEAIKFKEAHRLGEEPQPTHVAEPLVQSGDTAMVGLDAELIQLLDELTGNKSSRRIISIVGMGGSGKTTLAKNVCQNLLIKEYFQCRAWATISQQNNAKEILSKLLFGLGEFSNGTVDDLGLQLHKTLSCRRYLIVLDDIWSVKSWDEVKRFFPDNENGSRIVLTTRLSNVARDCGSSLFMLNLLNEGDSWKLFCAKTFQSEHCPPELLEVGKEIVQLCKGLALSIVVIGGFLLNSPRTIRYWRDVRNDLKSIINSKEKQESLDVLSLSYNHLPPHLKPCFLYMGVFKEDSPIRVSKIIRLWVAEGFIKPIGSRVLEEIAEGYIQDLIDRNLILVGRRTKNGKVGSCGIHDLLRDLCIKVAEEQDFFHASKSRVQGKERRLVGVWSLKPGRVGRPLGRSIIASEYSRQVGRYRLLRVLDAYVEGSQRNFGNINLRYLELRSTYSPVTLQKLPASLSNMWSLQTLIIHHIRPVKIAADAEFWKMRQLRHVKCSRIYLPSPPSNREDELLMLENFHTLKRVVNFKLCDEVCKIIPNIKKLHLVYNCWFQGYDVHSLIEYALHLDRFHKLESFNLNIEVGKRINMKFRVSFPSSLQKLCLDANEFEVYWEDLLGIGSLPHLEVVKLNKVYFKEGKWSSTNGQFRRLKFLKICRSNLICWDAENSHFPVLEKLLLFDLMELDEIPSGIGDVPTLELIDVSWCRLSTAISAVRIKEDRLENVGNDGLRVQVGMYAEELRSFEERLATEGLTIDIIWLRSPSYEYE